MIILSGFAVGLLFAGIFNLNVGYSRRSKDGSAFQAGLGFAEVIIAIVLLVIYLLIQ